MMKPAVIFGLLIAATVVGSFVPWGETAVGGDEKKEEEIPTVSEIMIRINNKKRGVHPRVAAELQKDSVDWAALVPDGKAYVKLTSQMLENVPSMGEKDSWVKLCDSYIADAKALSDGIAKKDRAAAQKALGRLQRSCKACHDEHQ